MTVTRRNFLKASGMSVLPALLPTAPLLANKINERPAKDPVVYFYFDGEFPSPTRSISILQEIDSAKPIVRDGYGEGGAVTDLENKFRLLTGKEQCMFMPTGTMANQLAIRELSGANTKVFVQETSHVFRDEADAAQSVHNKRLIPLAKGAAFFTADELEQAINYHNEGEVFRSGIGAVSIETPVRRTDGTMFPFDELERVTAFCRKNGYKLHLDGARLFMASAWSGKSIAEYSAMFDTVYISLYKYLGAAAGAVLCGDSAVIGKMKHLVKIYGGSMYSNWANAAIALYKLDGFQERLLKAKKAGEELFAMLNQLDGVKISAKPNGTNIHAFETSPKIDKRKMAGILANEHGIRFGGNSLTVNETILGRDVRSIFDSFKEALKKSWY